jgi:hypothetical protein
MPAPRGPGILPGAVHDRRTFPAEALAKDILTRFFPAFAEMETRFRTLSQARE